MEINLTVDKLAVRIFDDKEALGFAAASMAADGIRATLARRGMANVMFAAAKSQLEFLAALMAEPGIDWSRVNAFHMDEYTGVGREDRRSLAFYIESRFLGRLGLGGLYFLDGLASDRQAECERYAELLRAHPLDIAFLGIGDNGHLAFNDPHVADFDDPCDVKIVGIDDVSKRQQVNAGNFAGMADVPSVAYTVTIPALLRAETVLCVAPSADKARAAGQMLNGPIEERCPASILRRHGNATLFLDRDSASGVIPRGNGGSGGNPV